MCQCICCKGVTPLDAKQWLVDSLGLMYCDMRSELSAYFVRKPILPPFLTLVDPGKLFPGRGPVLWVGAFGGLVQDQQFGRAGHRAGEVEATFHAARAGTGHLLIDRQPHEFERLIGPTLDLLGGDSVQPVGQLQRFATGREDIERGCLHRQNEPPGNFVGVLRHIDAGDFRGARCGTE